MTWTRPRKIADAVLYEGYVLWPYSPSATKNQRRWTFGGVYPQAHTDAASRRPLADADRVPASRAPSARSTCRVRFLHVVERRVPRGDGEPVDELTVGDEHHVSWDEATEREVHGRRTGPRRDRDPGRRERRSCCAGGAIGALAGSGARRGSVEVARRAARRGLHRVTVRDREHDAVRTATTARRRCGRRSARRTRSCTRRAASSCR